jgi:hypothetical protein
MGFFNDLANTASGAVNTVGNIIQNPGAAIDTAGNAVGNALRDPDGTLKGAARYIADNPDKAAMTAAMMMIKKGGVIRSASARADGIAKRGKTRGKIY